jgi:hypothetical protein
VRTESRLDLNNSIIQELDSNEAVQVLVARCFVSKFTQEILKPKDMQIPSARRSAAMAEMATMMACKGGSELI